MLFAGQLQAQLQEIDILNSPVDVSKDFVDYNRTLFISPMSWYLLIPTQEKVPLNFCGTIIKPGRLSTICSCGLCQWKLMNSLLPSMRLRPNCLSKYSLFLIGQ